MQENQKRLLVICAHPDDCEYVAGICLQFKRLGHEVRFLTATNGSSGHHLMPGGALVRVREKEVEKVSQLTGFTHQMLDLEDGRLTTSLQERERMLTAIRAYHPDIIITHRPFDYHPDHRATSMLVQDCSYLLLVPNICPLSPPMRKMPAIFYMQDAFMRPCAFRPDLVFDITQEFDTKMQLFHQHASQMYEWLPWVDGLAEGEVPDGEEERLNWLKSSPLAKKFQDYADRFRGELIQKYGKQGAECRYAEALEACEYGRQMTKEEMAQAFPF